MIKTGYFRIKGMLEQTVSYQEFYSRGEVYAQYLRAMEEKNQIHMYCACQEEDVLELSITKNNVIRVKENGKQKLHAPYCPKSEEYNRYLSTSEKGVRTVEEGKLLFQISIPSGIKRESGGGSGESSGEPDPERQRTSLLDMVMAVNRYAWEKQTFSIKKQIKEAYQQHEKPDWTYKDEKQFTRLFFGVTNEVSLKIRGEICSLASICYRPADFKIADYKEKYFLYARVSRVSEFKEDRKYQYVTVRALPFDEKKGSVTVRIATEEYKKMKEMADPEGDIPVMLTGYVRHDCFDTGDKTSDWMTLVKGVFCYISGNGILVKNEYEAELFNLLCEKKLLFLRPYHPLHHFGNEIPFLMIERIHKKNVLLDVVSSTQKYTEHSMLAEQNPEYEILIIKKDTPPQEVYEQLLALLENKE